MMDTDYDAMFKFAWLEDLLEETHERMEALQKIYIKQTGKRWVPYRFIQKKRDINSTCREEKCF